MFSLNSTKDRFLMFLTVKPEGYDLGGGGGGGGGEGGGGLCCRV